MSNQKYKMLIAEDEPLILNYLEKKIMQISDRFIIVGKAQTGKEALHLIEETAPDVVMSDIRMPEMSGLELTEQLHRLYPQISVILLTGYADFSYAQQAIKYHVFDYLLKPLNPDELATTLGKLDLALSSSQSQTAQTPYATENISAQQTFELIREYIRLNYNQPIDLQILSDKFSYSPAYIIKLFKKYADITPNRYLTQLRINAACDLLIHANTPISMIGPMVGYSDVPHFSKLFKQYKDMSPAKYREKYGTGEN